MMLSFPGSLTRSRITSTLDWLKGEGRADSPGVETGDSRADGQITRETSGAFGSAVEGELLRPREIGSSLGSSLHTTAKERSTWGERTGSRRAFLVRSSVVVAPTRDRLLTILLGKNLARRGTEEIALLLEGHTWDIDAVVGDGISGLESGPADKQRTSRDAAMTMSREVG